MSSFSKDPDEKKDYGLDWSDALDGDTISDSQWAAETGITISSTPPATNDETTTTVWLEGGTLGEIYKVTNTVTTAGGRILEESLTIRCLEA